MSARREVIPEYIYTTIPAEYVCVYHKILAMLADFGEEMLKNCKASCTDRNSNVINCFNMFNAAVAASTIGNERLAELLLNYVKAKINQIYKDIYCLKNLTKIVEICLPRLDRNLPIPFTVKHPWTDRFYVKREHLDSGTPLDIATKDDPLEKGMLGEQFVPYKYNGSKASAITKVIQFNEISNNNVMTITIERD